VLMELLHARREERTRREAKPAPPYRGRGRHVRRALRAFAFPCSAAIFAGLLKTSGAMAL